MIDDTNEKKNYPRSNNSQTVKFDIDLYDSIDIKTVLTSKTDSSVIKIDYQQFQIFLNDEPLCSGNPAKRRFCFLYLLAIEGGHSVSLDELGNKLGLDENIEYIKGYKNEILKCFPDGISPIIAEGWNKSYSLSVEDYYIENVFSPIFKTLQTRQREYTHFSLPENFSEPSEFLTVFKKFFKECNSENSNNVISITGEQGSGKTTFVKYLCNCLWNQNLKFRDKKFESCIYTTYSDMGLEHTIASLPCEENEERHKDPYKFNINLLHTVSKPALLIIDNYNNPFGFREEIAETNRVYMDLIHTGCRIIIVSNNDLSKCYAIRQIEYPGLGRQLYDLFLCECRKNNIMGFPKSTLEMKDFENIAQPFISNYLKSNTYLTMLFVQLLRNHSLDRAIELFKNLDIESLDDSISVNKDGRQQPDMSLLDHYRRIFDIARISDDENNIRLLCLLSLMPVEGINTELFYDLAFDKGAAKDIKKAQAFLEHSHWVFLDRGLLSIKPIIRALIVNDYLENNQKYVDGYISNLNSVSVTETYHDRLNEYLSLTESAYLSFSKAGIRGKQYTYLAVNCAQNNDIIKRYDAAVSYGKAALILLDELAESDERPDNYTLARAYNRATNALQHNYRIEFPKELIFGGFKKAENYLKEESGIKAEDLRTKIMGNTAAAYLALKDYSSAYEMYNNLLDIRLDIYSKRNTDLQKDESSTRMLANTYRQIGTVLYYLANSNPDKRYELLQESLQNHWKSLSLYKQYLDNNLSEYYIETNRFAGTGIQLLKYDSFKGIVLTDPWGEHRHYRKGLYAVISELMSDALYYFKNMNKLESELEITKANRQNLKKI